MRQPARILRKSKTIQARGADHLEAETGFLARLFFPCLLRETAHSILPWSHRGSPRSIASRALNRHHILRHRDRPLQHIAPRAIVLLYQHSKTFHMFSRSFHKSHGYAKEQRASKSQASQLQDLGLLSPLEPRFGAGRRDYDRPIHSSSGVSYSGLTQYPEKSKCDLAVCTSGLISLRPVYLSQHNSHNSLNPLNPMTHWTNGSLHF